MSIPADWESIERPSRYLGGETNQVIKPEDTVRLRLALAFPDTYEIGMSHHGLKILYELVNRVPDFQAERVFAPWRDAEARLREEGRPLTTLETARPLSRFDAVGFSLQYELCYTNVLTMLELGGIPLRAERRRPEDPVVIGGGPIAAHPEPLAPFFDLFFFGEAEAGFIEVLHRLRSWRESRAGREELFADLAGLPGVYIPSLFRPVMEGSRIVAIEPLRPGYPSVRRAVLPGIDDSLLPERPLVPLAQPVHDRVAVEIARGCTRGCRFCQAGFLYRPVRERSADAVLGLMDRALAATGQEDAALLSLSAGDYSCLSPLISRFMDRYSGSSVALSLPSLRVKSVNADVMSQVKRVRKTGFTLAPEAGTQRLRDVINKDLTDADLEEAARMAYGMGWRVLKLYFMIGLPTETDEDVQAIVDLARRLKGFVRGRLHVSFAAFVPKPHTPFQWEAMIDRETASQRMETLRRGLSRVGLTPKWNESASSMLEGILSRGDRRLAGVIERVQARGGRFDAWDEQMRLGLWLDAMAEEGLSPDEYLGARDTCALLPWSHLHVGVSDEYLLKEREHALAGQTTPDCRDGACGACGVCDFVEVRPRLAPASPAVPAPEPPAPEGDPVRLRFRYAKKDSARFLSHLEIIRVFYRALRRAGLQLRMSQGFHPQPKMVFSSSLPVGVTGLDEYLDVELLAPPDPEEAVRLLAVQLPPGFDLLGVETHSGRSGPRQVGARYRLETDGETFDPEAGSRALAEPHVWITRKNRKGTRTLDLKDILMNLTVEGPGSIVLDLIQGEHGTVRPRAAAEILFALPEGSLDRSRVTKLKTLFEE